jgi:hypothetical protein
MSIIKNTHLYEHEIHPTWTPIEPISKDIQIGSNFFHIITRKQFPIQSVVACTIYWAQGLTLDYLTFNPTNVYKHNLSYTTLSHVKKKEIFYLLQPLQMKNFKLIQVLPWRYANCIPLHDGMYLSPNHIHFMIHIF